MTYTQVIDNVLEEGVGRNGLPRAAFELGAVERGEEPLGVGAGHAAPRPASTCSTRARRHAISRTATSNCSRVRRPCWSVNVTRGPLPSAPRPARSSVWSSDRIVARSHHTVMASPSR